MKRLSILNVLGVSLLAALAASAATIPKLEIPFHRQQKNGCGAASVAMVMDYWRTIDATTDSAGPTPREVYAALYQPDLNGIPLAEMKRYVESHGLRAFTLRGARADLLEHLAKGRPLIVATRGSTRKPIHFVVVTGLDDDSVWLNDPTRKRPHRMKLAKFEKHWALAEQWMLLAVAPARVPVATQ